MSVNYLRIENFLLPLERNQIFDFAVQNEHEFVKSVLTPFNNGGRSSKVMYQFPYADFVKNQLLRLLPVAVDALDIVVDSFSHIDCQLTASNDKDFLHPHPDKTSIITTRFLTFVYYLHKLPKPFMGGELVIYGNQDSEQSGNDFQVIEPSNNSLILFDSRLVHEVLPVRCPGGRFENSRFTVNGWFNYK